MDGHVKFWKKQDEGIEFVKHFRCHLGNIQCLCANDMGSLVASVSNDKSIKVFDVVNFGESTTQSSTSAIIIFDFDFILYKTIFFLDMINMMKADYVPLTCEWIHRSGDAVQALAV